MPELFTVGHSTHDIGTFLDLLHQHRIEVVADVRSTPYSRTAPHFTAEHFRRHLRRGGLRYVFLGGELGGRSRDQSHYVAGKVQYQRMAQSERFGEGLRRVREGMKRYTVALLCAERDPIDCHRAILVCRHLRAPDTRIVHILADGSLEPHERTEDRLLRIAGISNHEMFVCPADMLERAYDIQGDRIGYSQPRTTQNNTLPPNP